LKKGASAPFFIVLVFDRFFGLTVAKSPA